MKYHFDHFKANHPYRLWWNIGDEYKQMALQCEKGALRKMALSDETAREEFRDTIVDQFHRLFYDHVTAQKPKWFGTDIYKSPLDLWVMQEILYEVRPDVVIETGTGQGGSAYFIASVLHLIGNGFVMSIDRDKQAGRPKHARVVYLTGDSVNPKTLNVVSDFIASAKTDKAEPAVLVDLDSDHSPEHVFEELKRYAPLVTPGSYIIVEDTNVTGARTVELGGNVVTEPEGDNGAMVAVNKFLADKDVPFIEDRSREKFLFSFNPRGFLRRTGG